MNKKAHEELNFLLHFIRKGFRKLPNLMTLLHAIRAWMHGSRLVASCHVSHTLPAAHKDQGQKRPTREEHRGRNHAAYSPPPLPLLSSSSHLPSPARLPLKISAENRRPRRHIAPNSPRRRPTGALPEAAGSRGGGGATANVRPPPQVFSGNHLPPPLPS